MQLILIDSDPLASQYLSDRLGRTGYRILYHPSLESLLAAPADRQAEAVLIDVGNREELAELAVRRTRQAGIDQPLLVLKAGGNWRATIACLDAGADDCLEKPARSEEIAARLRAVIRRASGNPTDQLSAGPIELDLKARCAWLGGRCLDLTRTEFRLLCMFLLRHRQVLTHQEIRDRLYGEDCEVSLNAVEVQVARLRRKVGKQRIQTVRRVGYRFVGEEEQPADEANGREPCRACGANSVAASLA